MKDQINTIRDALEPLTNNSGVRKALAALDQIEAENAKLREALTQALKVMEGFDRFRRMMTDGPDASDKLLAEDYAEVAFLQAVEAIESARAALEKQS